MFSGVECNATLFCIVYVSGCICVIYDDDE